jgi:LytS/YehU family sensor histidine kinase
MDKKDIKNLKKRYLVWFYKQTKEALDKVDRKFTQLEVDQFILEELRRLDTSHAAKNYIEEFKVYIQNKEKDALAQKYEGKNLKPEYNFLQLKLKAIEKAVEKEFGKKGLEEIKDLYEKEMIKRVLEEKQQKL